MIAVGDIVKIILEIMAIGFILAIGFGQFLIMLDDERRSDRRRRIFEAEKELDLKKLSKPDSK